MIHGCRIDAAGRRSAVKEGNMAEVSIADRLAKYGLSERAADLTDLKVGQEQHVMVARDNPFFADRIHQLRPESIDDLKQWIGTPEGSCCSDSTHIPGLLPPALVSSALSDERTVDEHRTMNSLAGAYVFGHADSVAPTHLSAVNDWLSVVKARITISLFQDIYVSAGSTMSLAPSVHVLFARYITVENTGRIVLGNGSTTSIDCAGFRGHHLPIHLSKASAVKAAAIVKSN
jgi:hypothetical protein